MVASDLAAFVELATVLVVDSAIRVVAVLVELVDVVGTVDDGVVVHGSQTHFESRWHSGERTTSMQLLSDLD